MAVVIVTYEPNLSNVIRLCRTIEAGGAMAVVVDNGSTFGVAADLEPVGRKTISLADNTGIAHAQNVGIRYALKAGADIIAFFDQDSVVETDFHRRLIEALNPGVPGIVSPVIYDEVTGRECPTLRLNRFGFPVTVSYTHLTLPTNREV